MEKELVWTFLAEAFEKRKKIRVVFNDDSTGIFEVTDFNQTPEEPMPSGYSLKPDLPKEKKLLRDAKSIELID